MVVWFALRRDTMGAKTQGRDNPQDLPVLRLPTSVGLRWNHEPGGQACPGEAVRAETEQGQWGLLRYYKLFWVPPMFTNK